MRGTTFSGFFASSGLAFQPSWKSMRQTLSDCLCSSTDWPRWNGGSNQNQRSVGKSAFITTSAIRKRSWKNCPVNSAPTMRRVSLLAPSQAITQSASTRKMPSGVSMLSTAWSAAAAATAAGASTPA
jgi:hypothetical protein